MDHRGWDDATTTGTAILLGLTLLAAGGLALAMTDDNEGSPEPAGEQAAANETEPAPEDETHEIDWQGQLDTAVCAPGGPNVCYETSLGEADDRLKTGIADTVGSGTLELAWEATTPDTLHLELALVSGRTECGGNCHYWTVLEETSGTSPLTLDVSDVSPEGGDTLWLIVDTPDRTPRPVHGDAHTEQAFELTGELTTTPGST